MRSVMRKREIFEEQIYPALLLLFGWWWLPEGFGIRLLTMEWTDMWEMVWDIVSAGCVVGVSVWISSMIQYHPFVQRMINKNDNEED